MPTWVQIPLSPMYYGLGRIRTYGTFWCTSVFKTGAFNHSATNPFPTYLKIMAQVNLTIARALSRKRFLQRAQSAAYKKKQQEFELHLTFTANNIFVNFCTGVGETIFLKTFGIIGYFGVRRRTRYALFYYGLEIGEMLTKYFADLKRRSRTASLPVLHFYLHSALNNKDFRYKRFLEGVAKYSIKFTTIQFKTAVAYNGCKLPVRRRTRRYRNFQ